MAGRRNIDGKGVPQPNLGRVPSDLLSEAVPISADADIAQLPCMMAGALGTHKVVNLGQVFLADGQGLSNWAATPAELAIQLEPLMTAAAVTKRKLLEDALASALARRDTPTSTRNLWMCRAMARTVLVERITELQQVDVDGATCVILPQLQEPSHAQQAKDGKGSAAEPTRHLDAESASMGVRTGGSTDLRGRLLPAEVSSM